MSGAKQVHHVLGRGERAEIMNWLDCRVIEQIPGKLSGAPLIKGTRVRPEDVLNNLDLTEDEIAASFNLRLDHVHEVLDFFYRNETELTAG